MIFGLALIFKVVQTQQSITFDLGIISETGQGYRLFWRLWYVLIVS